MRTADELLASGLAVLDAAYVKGAYTMAPLFSGGHDSLCATHIASQHKAFRGVVHHIDTGIGAKYTREFVERVAHKQGWKLKVWKSPATYERWVQRQGFPGPGAHTWVYAWLKDRCVGYIVRGKQWKMLVTGCRSQESVRRMGHVKPVQIGEWSEQKQRWIKINRVWTAPCHDWSKAEQQVYMDEWGLPINKLKVALGLSGECLCGAFAQPGELKMIRQHAPDVAAEIDRLTEIAKANGTPCLWGINGHRGQKVPSTGPLCSSCDQRAAAAGFEIVCPVPTTQEPPHAQP